MVNQVHFRLFAEAASDSSARTPTLGQPRNAVNDGNVAARDPAAHQQAAAGGGRRGSGDGMAAPATQDSGIEALTSEQATLRTGSPAGPRDLGSYFGAIAFLSLSRQSHQSVASMCLS